MSQRDKNPFRDEMSRIRKTKRQRFFSQKGHAPSADLRKLGSLIRPIILKFVEADKAFELQSDTPTEWYINYAHAKLCNVAVSEGVGGKAVHVWTDIGEDLIYADGKSDSEILDAVSKALLDWYRHM